MECQLCKDKIEKRGLRAKYCRSCKTKKDRKISRDYRREKRDEHKTIIRKRLTPEVEACIRNTMKYYDSIVSSISESRSVEEAEKSPYFHNANAMRLCLGIPPRKRLHRA